MSSWDREDLEHRVTKEKKKLLVYVMKKGIAFNWIFFFFSLYRIYKISMMSSSGSLLFFLNSALVKD